MRVMNELYTDNLLFGSCRYLVTDEKDEFSIKRVRPNERVFAEGYYNTMDVENYYA